MVPPTQLILVAVIEVAIVNLGVGFKLFRFYIQDQTLYTQMVILKFIKLVIDGRLTNLKL